MSNSDSYQPRHSRPQPPEHDGMTDGDRAFWRAVNAEWPIEEETAAAAGMRAEAADWLHGAMQRARQDGRGDWAATFAVRAARIRQGKSI